MGRPKKKHNRTILPELNQSQTIEPSKELDDEDLNPMVKTVAKKPQKVRIQDLDPVNIQMKKNFKKMIENPRMVIQQK